MSSDVTSLRSFPTVSETEPTGSLMNKPELKRRGSRRESIVSFGSMQSSVTGTVPPNVRRRSTLKSFSQGILGLLHMRRMTMTKAKYEQPKIRYSNTYQLEPDRCNIFSTARVKNTMEDVLNNYLQNATYNETTCGSLACNIADIIKNRIKDLNFQRYRIICHVIIGEEKSQGMEVASMCVWNEKTDNYACATYRNNSLVATAMVHGIYLE